MPNGDPAVMSQPEGAADTPARDDNSLVGRADVGEARSLTFLPHVFPHGATSHAGRLTSSSTN
jgi:hypothetical protein